MSTTLSPVRRVDIVGVPMDLGASRRGVDMGPSAVRYAKLHEALRRLGIETIVDRGNLPVPIRESAASDDESAKFLGVITVVCNDLADAVKSAVREGGLPIVLGGDHSIALGTLEGLTRARGIAPGLVWVDAHADINSPGSSPTGNVHGMPLYFALEKGFAKAENTVQIGLRDVDPHEKQLAAPVRRESFQHDRRRKAGDGARDGAGAGNRGRRRSADSRVVRYGRDRSQRSAGHRTPSKAA